MHKIDLSKYNLRTDMVIDEKESIKEKIDEKYYEEDNIKVSLVKLGKNNVLDKKEGNYLTIEYDDITDTEYRKKVSKVFTSEFKKFLKKIGYNHNNKTLVVGLGNIKSTPDSLGPLVIEKIITTNHLRKLGNLDSKYSVVSAFYPGVTGETGIETYEYVKGVLDRVKPDILIIIDALSSSSISRLNKSIQVSDAGIAPGSGIGNNRKELSKENLGVPVVVVGIPTVTSASTIVSDTIKYMIKNYAYNKELSSKKVSKFIINSVNYNKKEVIVTDEDKKNLLGLVGLLTEEELKKLIYEVLTPIGYNLMVAPKEVDFIIDKLSKILSEGINNSLHNL